LEFLARAIRQEQEIKRIQIGKEEVKLSLFADDMILYLKDPKHFTKKLSEIINFFDKVAVYKIPNGRLPTMNRRERNQGNNLIYNTLKKNFKYQGINLAKETNNLFNENYKSLRREIKEDIRR
jgi:hypothetical protein